MSMPFFRKFAGEKPGAVNKPNHTQFDSRDTELRARVVAV